MFRPLFIACVLLAIAPLPAAAAPTPEPATPPAPALTARVDLGPALALSLDVTAIVGIDGRFAGTHTQVVARPELAWRPSAALAIWIGPTLNVLVTDRSDDLATLPTLAAHVGRGDGPTRAWMWPGLELGIRLL